MSRKASRSTRSASSPLSFRPAPGAYSSPSSPDASPDSSPDPYINAAHASSSSPSPSPRKAPRKSSSSRASGARASADESGSREKASTPPAPAAAPFPRARPEQVQRVREGRERVLDPWRDAKENASLPVGARGEGAIAKSGNRDVPRNLHAPGFRKEKRRLVVGRPVRLDVVPHAEPVPGEQMLVRSRTVRDANRVARDERPQRDDFHLSTARNSPRALARPPVVVAQSSSGTSATGGFALRASRAPSGSFSGTSRERVRALASLAPSGSSPERRPPRSETRGCARRRARGERRPRRLRCRKGRQTTFFDRRVVGFETDLVRVPRAPRARALRTRPPRLARRLRDDRRARRDLSAVTSCRTFAQANVQQRFPLRARPPRRRVVQRRATQKRVVRREGRGRIDAVGGDERRQRDVAQRKRPRARVVPGTVLDSRLSARGDGLPERRTQRRGGGQRARFGDTEQCRAFRDGADRDEAARAAASAPTRTFAWTTPPCARTRAASVDHERSSSSAVPTELFGFPAGDAPPRSAEELAPGGAEAFRFGAMSGSLHAPRWARGSLGDAARARVEEKANLGFSSCTS